MLDIYNALNANPIVTQNNTFGANWQSRHKSSSAGFSRSAPSFSFDTTDVEGMCDAG